MIARFVWSGCYTALTWEKQCRLLNKIVAQLILIDLMLFFFCFIRLLEEGSRISLEVKQWCMLRPVRYLKILPMADLCHWLRKSFKKVKHLDQIKFMLLRIRKTQIHQKFWPHFLALKSRNLIGRGRKHRQKNEKATQLRYWPSLLGYSLYAGCPFLWSLY